VYIEQPQYSVPPMQQNLVPPPGSAPQAQQQYWYFCNDSRTYYPYVQQCAGQWQRVTPRPPGQ